MAIITNDTFTESSDTTLASHTGETGASWTKHPSYPPSLIVIAASDTLQHEETGSAAYYVSSVPSSADYDVEADVILNASSAAAIGICGRFSTTANTFYHVRYNDNDNNNEWQLYKFVAGSATLLDDYAQSLTLSTPYNVRLEMIGSSIKVYIDDVERISVTDSSITAAGRAGVRIYDASSADYNDTSLDNFVVTEEAVGGRIMSSLTNYGGLAGYGGIAGKGGGLAG